MDAVDYFSMEPDKRIAYAKELEKEIKQTTGWYVEIWEEVRTDRRGRPCMYYAKTYYTNPYKMRDVDIDEIKARLKRWLDAQDEAVAKVKERKQR